MNISVLIFLLALGYWVSLPRAMRRSHLENLFSLGCRSFILSTRLIFFTPFFPFLSLFFSSFKYIILPGPPNGAASFLLTQRYTTSCCDAHCRPSTLHAASYNMPPHLPRRLPTLHSPRRPYTPSPHAVSPRHHYPPSDTFEWRGVRFVFSKVFQSCVSAKVCSWLLTATWAFLILVTFCRIVIEYKHDNPNHQSHPRHAVNRECNQACPNVFSNPAVKSYAESTFTSSSSPHRYKGLTEVLTQRGIRQY